jgi:hypothetical protein
VSAKRHQYRFRSIPCQPIGAGSTTMFRRRPYSSPPTYPPPKEWTHGFGSILKFTENNFFGPAAQIAPLGYSYADSNSLDQIYLPSGVRAIPLWDFFLGQPRAFTPIPTTNSPSYFMNYYTTQQNGTYPVPTGPDGGPDD